MSHKSALGNLASFSQLSTHVSSFITILLRYTLTLSWYHCIKDRPCMKSSWNNCCSVNYALGGCLRTLHPNHKTKRTRAALAVLQRYHVEENKHLKRSLREMVQDILTSEMRQPCFILRRQTSMTLDHKKLSYAMTSVTAPVVLVLRSILKHCCIFWSKFTRQIKFCLFLRAVENLFSGWVS